MYRTQGGGGGGGVKVTNSYIYIVKKGSYNIGAKGQADLPIYSLGLRLQVAYTVLQHLGIVIVAHIE